MKNNLIISENQRSFWQRIMASIFFTAAIALLIYMLYSANWTDKNLKNIGYNFSTVIYLVAVGISFSFNKNVYIDVKKSRFRATFEVGPFKLGQWKTIHNYEYVSIFHQPLTDGEKIYEVNLWYDKNQHWELYTKYDLKEAFLVGFEISELLEIKILDATRPNDYKWIDKQATIKKGEIIYFE
jgi:hypothetical protein